MDKALQDKILATTDGSKFGAILRCAFGRNETTGTGRRGIKGIAGPAFIGKASVTSDSFVMCDFIDRNGECHLGAMVGGFGDLEHNAQHLANFMGLNDDQKSDLLKVIADWIGEDYRTKKVS